MLPRRDEGFLRDVVALAKIANPAISKRRDQCLVSRHNAAEGVEVAIQTEQDEIRIAWFPCSYRSIGDHTAEYVPGRVNKVTKNITAPAKRKTGALSLSTDLYPF